MPNIGERKEINGTTGEWNGTTWKRVYTNADAAGRPVAPFVPSEGMAGAPSGITPEAKEVTSGPGFRTPEFDKQYQDARLQASIYNKQDEADLRNAQEAQFAHGDISTDNSWPAFAKRAVAESAAEATPTKMAALAGLLGALPSGGLSIPAAAAVTAGGSLAGDASQYAAEAMGSQNANPRSLEGAVGGALVAGGTDAAVGGILKGGGALYNRLRGGAQVAPSVYGASTAAASSGVNDAVTNGLRMAENVPGKIGWAARLANKFRGRGAGVAEAASDVRPPGVQSVGEPIRTPSVGPRPQRVSTEIPGSSYPREVPGTSSPRNAPGFAESVPPRSSYSSAMPVDIEPVGAPIREGLEELSPYGRTSAPANAPGYADIPEVPRVAPGPMSPRLAGPAPVLNDELTTVLEGLRRNQWTPAGNTPPRPHVGRTGDAHEAISAAPTTQPQEAADVMRALQEGPTPAEAGRAYEDRIMQEAGRDYTENPISPYFKANQNDEVFGPDSVTRLGASATGRTKANLIDSDAQVSTEQLRENLRQALHNSRNAADFEAAKTGGQKKIRQRWHIQDWMRKRNQS